jgi:hypothetical protein
VARQGHWPWSPGQEFARSVAREEVEHVRRARRFWLKVLDPGRGGDSGGSGVRRGPARGQPS